jgi:SAM-dependent methyltransferase
MDVTSRFVLDYMRRFAASHAGAAILDFGCGAGELVAAGRAEGLNVFGSDVFYSGSDSRVRAEASALWGEFIRESPGGRLPFPDCAFGLVVNNQVMEHVEDLEGTLAEIHRVLRPQGTLLSLFPSRDVWREGHIGIPLSHWFAKNSRARFYYTWTLRVLGAGTWKQQAPTCRRWAEDKLDWLDRYTRYRSREEILRTYGKYFRSEFHEPDYIRFRLRVHARSAPLAHLLDLPFASGAARAVFRKLAFLVMVSQRRDA